MFLISSNSVENLSFTVARAYEKADKDLVITKIANEFVNSCEAFLEATGDQDLKGAKTSLVLMRKGYLMLNYGDKNSGGRIIPMPFIGKE